MHTFPEAGVFQLEEGEMLGVCRRQVQQEPGGKAEQQPLHCDSYRVGSFASQDQRISSVPNLHAKEIINFYTMLHDTGTTMLRGNKIFTLTP